MLSEINFNAVFTNGNKALEAWSRCDPLYPLTSLREDEPPTLESDGVSYRVSCAMRIYDVEARDLLVKDLTAYKAYTTSGTVAYHDCYHDEGKPCENLVTESWGEV